MSPLALFIMGFAVAVAVNVLVPDVPAWRRYVAAIALDIALVIAAHL